MLWRRLALSRNTNETELPTWLSTHPTHDARAEKLEGLLPKVNEKWNEGNLYCVEKKVQRPLFSLLPWA